MKFTFFKGIGIGSAVAVIVLGTSTAFAGTGTGAIFNIGKFNGVNATSALGGLTNGPQLAVTNTGNLPNSSGINIKVHSGKPPLVVNSSTKVTNLNSDTLDGIDSSGFVQGSGRIVTAHRFVANSQGGTVISIPGFITVGLNCGASGAGGNYQLTVGSAAVLMFADNGTANPQTATYNAGTLVANSAWSTAATGDSITFSFAAPGKVATVYLFSSPSTGGCAVQGHAIVSA